MVPTAFGKLTTGKKIATAYICSIIPRPIRVLLNGIYNILAAITTSIILK
jgi:hypothetical protein